MVKKRCSRCSYWFAVPVAEVEATSRCPDCASKGSRDQANVA
jgi:predicted Zn-ribbon and HTH transcriptional regulator